MADTASKEVPQQPKRNQKTPRNINKGSNNRHKIDKHNIKKRVPLKSFQRPNDIYITGKSNFKAQVKQCNEILKSEEGEVFLHAIGKAINRAISLSLNLVADSEGAYAYEANTSTIELTDDHHPLHDEDDYAIQQRMNSCLHIRVFRNSKNFKT